MGQACQAITHNDKDLQASWGRAETELHDPDLKKERFKKHEPEHEEEIQHEINSEYESEYGDTTVSVKVCIDRARGLRNADWLPGTGKSDPYCIVKYKAQEIYRTKIISDNLDPVWNEDFSKDDFISGEPLEFEVWDDDGPAGDDNLGHAVVDYEVFKGSGFSGEIQLQGAGNGISAYVHLRIKVGSEPHLIPGHKHEFDIELEKDQDDKGFLGLKLDTQDGKTACVTEIEMKGACQKHNDNVDEHREGHHIRKGDFIVSANEAKDDSNLILEELKKKDEKVKIHIKRAMEIKVDVLKKDDTKHVPLGLHFRDPVGYSLIITKVDEESAVDKWNKGQGKVKKKYKVGHGTQEDPSLQIQPGDRIIAVAGLAAKASDLHRRINLQHEHLSFTVVRPVPDPDEKPAAAPDETPAEAPAPEAPFGGG